MELLKDKLSKATCVTYALESMIYLTAGITDDYEDADTDVETAIIRIFAQRNLLTIASIALDFMGPKTLLHGQPHNLTLRNTLQLYTHGEPLDSLNLLVGLSGIQQAGVSSWNRTIFLEFNINLHFKIGELTRYSPKGSESSP